MKKPNMKLITGLAALLAVTIAPAGASAHVTVSPEEAPAEGYAMLTFTVPHGCDEAATNSVRVKMPPQVVSATPGVVAGWKIRTVEGKLPRPSEMHGEKVIEGVREVTWTGGPLAPDQLEQFPLSVALSGESGEEAEFKVLQGCVDGSETAWIQSTPAGGGEPEHPAPAVALGDGGEGHGEPSGVITDPEGRPASAAESDESGDGLAIAALVVGALGLIAGAAALATARGKKS